MSEKKIKVIRQGGDVFRVREELGPAQAGDYNNYRIWIDQKEDGQIICRSSENVYASRYARYVPGEQQTVFVWNDHVYLLGRRINAAYNRTDLEYIN